MSGVGPYVRVPNVFPTTEALAPKKETVRERENEKKARKREGEKRDRGKKETGEEKDGEGFSG